MIWATWQKFTNLKSSAVLGMTPLINHDSRVQASGEQASVVIKFAQINVNYWSSNNVKPWLPGLLLMVYDVNING